MESVIEMYNDVLHKIRSINEKIKRTEQTIASKKTDHAGSSAARIAKLEEQIAIADFLDSKCGKIKELYAELEHQMDVLDRYRQSMVFECVTGKRRVEEAKADGIS